MVKELFIQICNMSLTASYVILAVLLARILLKRAPKIYSYCLWGIVLLRLICPFALESSWSLVRMNPQVIPQNYQMSQETFVEEQVAGNLPAGEEVNDVTEIVLKDASTTEATMASTNPIQVIIGALPYIWLTGILLLFAFGSASYIRFRKRIENSKIEYSISAFEMIGNRKIRVATLKNLQGSFAMALS